MTHNTILKSTGAILAGFFLTVLLSVAADFALNAAGMMNMENFKENSVPVVLLVILYRFVFNVMGCYLTAKLAPSNPMKLCLIIGVVGTVLSAFATAAMWDQVLIWYNFTVIGMSIPCAYLGAKLFLQSQAK